MKAQNPMEAVVKVQRHYPDMALPRMAHPTDAGYDLTAMGVEPLRPKVFAFDTGISAAVSPGYYCEVVPRSSIVKTDFMLANSVGIIDPDYRGRIRVVLRWLGDGAGEGEALALVGQRIAQMIVRRREQSRLEPADQLDDTRRGAGGFGSTGN
ncbi:MAG: dUTP diphosphatase [Deltaproteobacteria bacterium]|nr:dUTP diphosphatase [Deltaproteobacteria bacterium]